MSFKFTNAKIKKNTTQNDNTTKLFQQDNFCLRLTHGKNMLSTWLANIGRYVDTAANAGSKIHGGKHFLS